MGRGKFFFSLPPPSVIVICVTRRGRKEEGERNEGKMKSDYKLFFSFSLELFSLA